MTTTQQLAKHLREVYFGGNWTWSNLKDQLSDVTLEKALEKHGDLNTIAALTYHIDYYVQAITRVLKGEALNSKDEFSFEHPEFESEFQWKKFCHECFDNADALCWLIDKLDDSILNDLFVEAKYGTYHRNILGLIEHTHYHLGQIAIIKKLEVVIP